jgi:trk system potassium uptake protein TrkA
MPAAVVGEWSDPTGQLVLVERVLPESWAGKSLRGIGMPGKVSVVAVTRAGLPRLEVADLVGQEGDVLHLAVLKDAVGELERRFEGENPHPDGRTLGTAS